MAKINTSLIEKKASSKVSRSGIHAKTKSSKSKNSKKYKKTYKGQGR